MTPPETETEVIPPFERSRRKSFSSLEDEIFDEKDMSVDFANQNTLPTEPSKRITRRKTIMGRLRYFDEEKTPVA